MGLQLIFVVETNKKCKSDWIYIKNTIDRFYKYDKAHIRLSPVYMDGKTNYLYKEKEVKNLIKQYKATASNNETKVIYCFDCDEYDTKPEDLEFIKKTQKFCKNNRYEQVWFCKDIERVYLGKKVSDSQKKKEAEKFMAKKLIDGVPENNLISEKYGENLSNILKILDKYIPPLERK